MVANFFIAVNFYALLTTAASFAISEFGETEAKAGFGAGIFVIGALISRIVVSRRITRPYYKKTLLIGTSLLIIFTALLFTANNFMAFCVIRFIGGTTFGVNNNTLMTMVTSTLPDNRKGEGVGWFALSQILGMALGPFCAVSIMHLYGFQEVFILATFVSVIAFIVIIFVKQPKETEQNASAPIQNSAHKAAAIIPTEQGVWRFFDYNTINIAILCFILFVCNTNYMSFAAIFVSESGAESISSVIFLASAGATFASRPIIGKLFDKHGPNIILVCGFILFAAGFFLISQGIISVFLLSAVLIGLGTSSLQGATFAMVVSNTPKHRLAIANATYFFSLDLGSAIGPTFGGRIVEFAGYGTMYTICAVIVIACLPLYFGILAKR